MIVVIIIAIMAGFAVPKYQRYVIKTKRANMMVELQAIANKIEAKKIARGGYENVTSTGVGNDIDNIIGNAEYPKGGTALYIVTVSPSPITAQWKISAVPKVFEQMSTDGTLTLNYQGVKCRASKCGMGNEWQED